MPAQAAHQLHLAATASLAPAAAATAAAAAAAASAAGSGPGLVQALAALERDWAVTLRKAAKLLRGTVPAAEDGSFARVPCSLALLSLLEAALTVGPGGGVATASYPLWCTLRTLLELDSADSARPTSSSPSSTASAAAVAAVGVLDGSYSSAGVAVYETPVLLSSGISDDSSSSGCNGGVRRGVLALERGARWDSHAHADGEVFHVCLYTTDAPAAADTAAAGVGAAAMPVQQWRATLATVARTGAGELNITDDVTGAAVSVTVAAVEDAGVEKEAELWETMCANLKGISL
jgi:hypothetical protein